MPAPLRSSPLHPATEECDFCRDRYVYELEVRCHDCDRPMCPICAVTVRSRRETWCSECDPDAPGGEPGRRAGEEA